jgi:GTP cyclohydrolase I
MSRTVFNDDAAVASPPTNRQARIAGFVRNLLAELGEDPSRDGLRRTPQRVAAAMEFFTEGYGIEPDDVFRGATFDEDYNEMVIVRDIDFYALCEHHLLPFFGKCHVAYIPNGRIVGLSKLPRVVDVFARRLQVQERMTQQIASAIDRALRPLGVAVVCEAAHMCMMMRGVQKQNSLTTTSAMLGEFAINALSREEFLRLIATGGAR